MLQPLSARALLLLCVLQAIILGSTRLVAQTGCSPNPTPFTDLGNMPSVFCQAVAEAYFTGITNGTSATTYEPESNVNRGQMAAFVTRTLDQSLRRGSRRAALQQWWTPRDPAALGRTDLDGGHQPLNPASDGHSIWVPNRNENVGDLVQRVFSGDGRVTGTWTNVQGADTALAAAGFIWVTGRPGNLYRIDPKTTPGIIVPFNISLGAVPRSLTFDGLNIWTANSEGASISRVNIATNQATTFTAGFSSPVAVIFDGSNLWVKDAGDLALKRVNPATGEVTQTVPVGPFFSGLVFDGTNIWVPGSDPHRITIVRASTGAVLATLTGNGLNWPWGVAFDGERILVTNPAGDSVSLWKAADLTPLGSVSTGAGSFPRGVCSDGLNFWITMGPPAQPQLARF